MNIDRTYPAGELDKIVLLDNDIEDYGSTYLVWSDDMFSTTISPTCHDRNCVFDINDQLSRRAGAKELLLVSSGTVLDRRQVTITPLERAQHIESYVGPKTVQVDLDEPAMITAVPLDQYGNVLAEGAEIAINERSTRGSSQVELVYTKSLIGHKIVRAQDASDIIYIAAKTKDGFSKEQIVQSVTGLPAAIELRTIEYIPYADNRQISSFGTSTIKDTEGNVVPDGSMIYLSVDGIQGDSKYRAFTVDGKAKFFVPNPDRKTNWTLQASTSTGILSNSLAISYESNLTKIPVRLNKEEQQIVIGPLVGYLGQYVPDGTKVSMVLQQNDTLIESLHFSEDGFVKVSIRDFAFSGMVWVTINSCGIEHQEEFEI